MTDEEAELLAELRAVAAQSAASSRFADVNNENQGNAKMDNSGPSNAIEEKILPSSSNSRPSHDVPPWKCDRRPAKSGKSLKADFSSNKSSTKGSESNTLKMEKERDSTEMTNLLRKKDRLKPDLRSSLRGNVAYAGRSVTKEQIVGR